MYILPNRRLGYYDGPFPMPQGVSAGPYPTFSPPPGGNPGLGWYSSPFPMPQGVSAGPYPTFAPPAVGVNGLAGYRPNSGMYRGRYPGASKALAQFDIASGSLDLSDPSTWLGILGIGVVLYLIFSAGKKASGAYSRAQSRSKRRRAARAQIAALQAAS